MEQNGIKNAKNGDLGAAKMVIPVALFLNEGGGRVRPNDTTKNS